MVLVDSVYINFSGGLVLLKYLVDRLEDEGVAVYYLFDDRTYDCFRHIPEDRRCFISANFFSRYRFYRKNKSAFSKVLCFGNVPPPLRLTIPVFTYFHYGPLLTIQITFKRKDFVLYIKALLIKLLKDNTSFFIVQTQLGKEQIEKLLVLDKTKVLVMPFYDDRRIYKNGMLKEKDSYLYVSNWGHHKNHNILLDAWEKLFIKGFKLKLLLTIPENNVDLIYRINKLRSRGLQIQNAWFQNVDDLNKLYNKAEYVVYPSLAESFGLGLAEAADVGCKIIGANLPYTYQIVQPSLTFDPFSVDDIVEKIIFSFNHKLRDSEKVVGNRINEILSLIQVSK